METRIKWLRSAEVDGPLIAAFSAVAAGRPFTKHSEVGFTVSEARPRSVTGRFVERLSGTRAFTDPFGGRFELPFVTYETTAFRLSATFPQLELVNPPRSTKRFLNQISDSRPGPFTIEPAAVDLVRWVDALASKLGAPNVGEVRCGDLALMSSLSADIAFSGSEDVLGSARKFLGHNFTNVYYVRLSLGAGPKRLDLALNATGTARVFSDFDPKVTSVLRDALNAASE